MLVRYFAFLVLVVLSVSHSNAQVNIETGFFINEPDYQNPTGDYSISFSGNLEDNSHLGMSLRVGAFIFGFETLLNNGPGRSGNVSVMSGGGESISAGFTTTNGPQHRAMMGVMLSRNVAVYGFHGLMGYSDNRNISYNEASQHSKKIWVGPGCVYEFVTATHSTSGFDSLGYDGFQNTFGAGMESFLLGGVLRLEYNMTHRDGFSQSTKLNYSTSDSRIKNPGGLSEYTYNWQANTTQVIQLRWRKTF